MEPSAFVAEGNPQTINGAPVISGNPPQAIKIGVTYTFTPTASDPEGDALVFSVANMPIWAEFDQATGRLSGIPFLGSEGSYADIEINVSDGVSSTALPPFTITVESVNAANMPPEIDGTPAASVTIGSTYSFSPASSDPDGDLLTFTAQNVPSWAMFSTVNGTLSGTPQAGDEGTYANVAISVSDNISTASLPAFSIQVIGLNASPSISGTPDSQITVGQNYSFVPVATDPDGDTLTFSVQNMPAWATFDSQTGALSGIPQAGDAGTFAGIIIDVTDGMQTAALPTFSIDVNATNSPPNISGAPGTQAVVGQNYTFTPTAADPDGDTISFSVQNAPGWLSIDAVSGTLAGVPQSGDTGTASGIVISATDGTAASALPAFSINVVPTNNPPVISGTPGNQATVGTRYSFTPTASDPDGDALSFSVQNRPLWLALNASTGELTGTPQAGD
ncbi:MAG: thrombospondin type 3 repeat family protein, partial [Gammaproteobacteria bacterium]|nr:thrombospondin type 3 repeat family protein [Gammaproteobacteria bacterium]